MSGTDRPVRWAGLALAALCLSAALLVAFRSRTVPTALHAYGHFHPEDTHSVWHAVPPFYPSFPDGTAIRAGDTIGWALEESQWRTLNGWAEGAGLAGSDDRDIRSGLTLLGLDEMASRLFRKPAAAHRPDRQDSAMEAGGLRVRAQVRLDSLERELYRVRRQWREEADPALRQAITASLQQLEIELNAARARRDGIIRASEGRAPSEARQKTVLDTILLRAMADSLLRARAVRAPAPGILKRSGSTGPGADAWFMIGGNSCLWHFVWAVPPDWTFAAGQHLVLEDRDSARQLTTEVRAGHDRSLSLYITDCAHAGILEGTWVWKRDAPRSARLLNTWLGWRARTARDDQTGRAGS